MFAICRDGLFWNSEQKEFTDEPTCFPEWDEAVGIATTQAGLSLDDESWTVAKFKPGTRPGKKRRRKGDPDVRELSDAEADGLFTRRGPRGERTVIEIDGRTYPSGQLRVLRVLFKARGPLTRGDIAERAGVTAIFVGKAIGRSDPEARRRFEQTKDGGFRDSLLTLGYVREIELVVPEDGINESIFELTPAGREVASKLVEQYPEEQPGQGDDTDEPQTERPLRAESVQLEWI